ncbi:MAG TPA: magnesium-translocating P-type ATPase [Byssovorax sp.]|jgi:Mg2+-importing ATPase
MLLADPYAPPPAASSPAARPPPARGLGEDEALRILKRVGPNEPTVASKDGFARRTARRFASPLVIILVFASVVSAALGDVANAAIVWVIVLGSVVLELVQTGRSERAAAALQREVAPTATVVRDGVAREIPRRDVVPGDVIRLSAGDMVPADARLVASNDLHVAEGALTGESMPVEKAAGDTSSPATPDVHDPRFVFLGCSVVSGTATALVVATGPATAFGAVAKTLVARAPRTEFEQGVARFGVFILKTVLFLVLFVFVVSAALHRDPLQSLLFAVALAVGLTPEFLPMITTVTLGRGAQRMAKQRVIVKNLAAIQNLGSIDVLCCDKTGTLTTGHMVLERHVDARGAAAELPLLFAYVNSYFESGVDNGLDAAVLRKARVDPLDAAVLAHEHPTIDGYRKVDEIPFDFERRRVSVVVERDGARLLVTKGAPEHVLSVCSSCVVDGRTLPLDDAAREVALEVFRDLGARGYRVLGVATKPLATDATFAKDDESALVFQGFVAFVDPPRDDAAAAIEDLARAGVRVKVVTGDNELVAAHVCERVGISSPRVLLGSEIASLTDPALFQRVEDTDVFARVSPAQKSRVLATLRARGHVVGFLGDGINDAPSLHVADVGISVSGATDVAKDAASIILLDPSLGALHAGIVEGRRAHANVMKYLVMGTSSNFGNMFSMAAAAVLLPFLPMLPSQILLNGFLYDLSQVALPTDRVDGGFASKPRRWDIDVIRRFMLIIGPISSIYDLLTFYVMLRVFHAGEAAFHTGWFIESLATQTLVVFVIRTSGSVVRGRPSRALIAACFGVVAVGVALPFTPIGRALGFSAPPLSFFAFVLVAVVTYLGFVEVVKRRLLRDALG